MTRPGRETTSGEWSAEAPCQTWDLINTVYQMTVDAGVGMSRSKISRLVRAWEHRVRDNGWSFGEYLFNRVRLSVEQQHRLVADPRWARVISYADPVGEHAVNIVMSQRGW